LKINLNRDLASFPGSISSWGQWSSQLDDLYQNLFLYNIGFLSLFYTPCCISLGYGISADFKMLSRSWTFAADVISSPKRVLDLQMLARMVTTSHGIFIASCPALFQAFRCCSLVAGWVYMVHIRLIMYMVAYYYCLIFCVSTAG
jgi:hypothetical protein